MEKSIKFFELLFSNNHIKFRCINGSKIFNVNGLFNANTISALKQANDQNFEVYFVPNGGGYRNSEIKEINAVFIDLDLKDEIKSELCKKGLDEEDSSKEVKKITSGLSIEENKRYKEIFKTRIRKSPLKPSSIIETKNGFHIYWFVQPSSDIDSFVECERRLVSYFNADKAVQKPCNLMRVPSFFHCKDKKDKFLVKVIELNTVRYSLKQIKSSFPEVIDRNSVNRGKLFSTSRNQINSIDISSNLKLIQNKDIIGLRKVLFGNEDKKGKIYISNNLISNIPFVTNIFSNRDELYDYIFKIDLAEFLGIQGKSFNCIFHDDRNPSASIFINSDDSHFIYKCHSSNCGFVGNIIRCVERLQNCDKPQAINFLKSVYGLELLESDWQKEQKELLQLNNDYLLSDQFQLEYPELFKLIKNYIPLLITLNHVAIDNIFDRPLNDSKGALFFISTTKLMKISGIKSLDKINKRINLFVLLGLLEKLQEDEIPKRLKEKAIRIAQKMKISKGASIVKHVSFYTIPSYCDKYLSEANHQSILYKNNHMTMTGWSRELIYRNFGEETLKRVYPQGEWKLSNKSLAFEIEFDKALISLITKQGYVTERQIIYSLREKESTIKPYVKRVLNESLEKYNLVRIKMNKTIKDKFNIKDIKGYPFVIIPKGN